MSRFLAVRNLCWLSSADGGLKNRRGAQAAALLAVACIGLAAAGCGSSSPSTAISSSSKVSGTVNVAYASSLQYLNEKVVGPAFTKATGYKYSAVSANSSGTLESDIASGEIHPECVRERRRRQHHAAVPQVHQVVCAVRGYLDGRGLQPQRASTPSKFKAIADGSKPLKDLFTLLQTPGLKLGRTDPNADPQGRDFIYMLELAQSYYHLPSDTVTKILGGPTGSSTSSQIYAESSLDSTLESGQLDASSAFITQAIELHLDYIPLPAAINLGDFSLAAHVQDRHRSRSPRPAARRPPSTARRRSSTSRSSASRRRPRSRSSSTRSRRPAWRCTRRADLRC